jgi:8-oxo-dGTP pyrophosphatase MutT (NUDIX family)
MPKRAAGDMSSGVLHPMQAATGWRDPFDREPPLPATMHPFRAGAYLFRSVEHKMEQVRNICAAGIIPIMKSGTGEVQVLLAEEDLRAGSGQKSKGAGERDGESGGWEPGLGLLGGKVDVDDGHWLVTAHRELNEETAGLLSSSALADVLAFDPRDEAWSCALASSFCAYLPQSKYELLYYPVPEAHAEEWRCLPQRYAEFGGTISEDRRRSAQKLHWVTIHCEASGAPRLSEVPHTCANNDRVACALRCGRQVACASVGNSLPLKFELRAGLNKALNTVVGLVYAGQGSTKAAYTYRYIY